MLRILPHIASLQEHLHRLIYQPEDYRPEHCPHCGQTHLQRHGHYCRKPRGDSGNGKSAATQIPRFHCRDCGVTCSVLPSYIAPRRWYLWSIQQAVLVYLLCGGTQEQCAQELAHLGPAQSTIQRWWRWLRRRNNELSLHLRCLHPEWGRTADWCEFWRVAMEQEPLRELMASLDALGVAVP